MNLNNFEGFYNVYLVDHSVPVAMANPWTFNFIAPQLGDFAGFAAVGPDFPEPAEVIQGVLYDNGAKVGTYKEPDAANVLSAETFGPNGSIAGTYTPDFPAEAEVIDGVSYDNGNLTGNYQVPDVSEVLQNVHFGPAGALVGELQLIDPDLAMLIRRDIECILEDANEVAASTANEEILTATLGEE